MDKRKFCARTSRVGKDRQERREKDEGLKKWKWGKKKKSRISKMGLGGLREKSRRNSSTFTHIPRCVVGKT